MGHLGKLLAALLFGAIGLFLIAASLDWITLPVPKHQRALFHDPRHWQITAIGGAFLFAGLSLAFSEALAGASLLFRVLSVLVLVAAMGGIVYELTR